MADILKLTILTPDKSFYNGEIVELTTESALGSMSILPNHIGMVTSLIPTVSIIKTVDEKTLRTFTSSGVLKIQDNQIEMLCDTAEWPDEIDAQRAEKSKVEAEKLIEKKDGVDIRRAELKLRRSLMRLKAKE